MNTEMSRPLRLVLLDDELLTRAALEELLSEQGYEVAGAYSEPTACLDHLTQDNPDVLLLDLALKAREGLDGLSVLSSLCQRFPTVRVVVLSGTYIGGAAMRCRSAGARAFLPKRNVTAATIQQTIESVMNGAEVFPPGGEMPNPGLAIDKSLSGRELEVLGYVAGGADNLQIAAHLGITERTVKAHVSAIYAKLNVENRVQLALAAQQAGIPVPQALDR